MGEPWMLARCHIMAQTTDWVAHLACRSFSHSENLCTHRCSGEGCEQGIDAWAYCSPRRRQCQASPTAGVSPLHSWSTRGGASKSCLNSDKSHLSISTLKFSTNIAPRTLKFKEKSKTNVCYYSHKFSMGKEKRLFEQC